MIASMSSWLGPLVDRWYVPLQWVSLGAVLIAAAVTVLTTWAGMRSNAAGQRALEDEKAERLKMEASIAPRSIDQSQFKALEKFTPMNAMVVSVPDWEARQTAGQIKFLLNTAGWQIIDDNVHPMFGSDPMDGIHIEVPRVIRDDPSSLREWVTPTLEDLMNKDPSLDEAAEELRKQLVEGSGVDVVIGRTLALPPKTLRIAVGANPMTYFKEKALERAKKRQQERHDGNP
jgi:hypothetical protein